MQCEGDMVNRLMRVWGLGFRSLEFSSGFRVKAYPDISDLCLWYAYVISFSDPSGSPILQPGTFFFFFFSVWSFFVVGSLEDEPGRLVSQ